jgi:hypothetical protein
MLIFCSEFKLEAVEIKLVLDVETASVILKVVVYKDSKFVV